MGPGGGSPRPTHIAIIANLFEFVNFKISRFTTIAPPIILPFLHTEPFAIDKDSFLSVAIGPVTYDVRYIISAGLSRHIMLSRCHGIIGSVQPRLGVMQDVIQVNCIYPGAPFVEDM